MFIFIATHRVKPGKIDGFREYLNELGQFVETNNPSVMHFGAYISEDGTEATNIQVHPHEDSMNRHMQVAGNKIVEAYQFLDGTKSIEIYGALSDSLLAQIRQYAGDDVPVTAISDFRGFSRLQTA